MIHGGGSRPTPTTPAPCGARPPRAPPPPRGGSGWPPGRGAARNPGRPPGGGETAARLADVLVVTDDNPRSEDPAAIRAALLAGTASGAAEVLEVGDRRAAIRAALARASAGDIVLIAGKGHESGQEVGDVVHPFDYRAVAREELAR